ncbi:MAG: AbrB/MazE/SpoVT family DNA-binding domain-containing protein [Dehalococcoidia bacterium]
MTEKYIKTKISDGGRLVIPAAYRKALGLKPGDEVFVGLRGNEIIVLSMRQAITQAQSLVREYIPAGRNLSGELIKERHEETLHD